MSLVTTAHLGQLRDRERSVGLDRFLEVRFGHVRNTHGGDFLTLAHACLFGGLALGLLGTSVAIGTSFLGRRIRVRLKLLEQLASASDRPSLDPLREVVGPSFSLPVSGSLS